VPHHLLNHLPVLIRDGAILVMPGMIALVVAGVTVMVVATVAMVEDAGVAVMVAMVAMVVVAMVATMVVNHAVEDGVEAGTVANNVVVLPWSVMSVSRDNFSEMPKLEKMLAKVLASTLTAIMISQWM
jgi:predicted type IV restriction endonuclease